MEGKQPIEHPLGQYVVTDKDKSGLVQAMLRIPYTTRQECQRQLSDPQAESDFPADLSPPTSLDYTDRGMADGGFSDHLGLPEHDQGALRGRADGRTEDDVKTGALNAEDAEDADDDESDFDDFSDGEQVNIIKIVNGDFPFKVAAVTPSMASFSLFVLRVSQLLRAGGSSPQAINWLALMGTNPSASRTLRIAFQVVRD